MDRRRSELGFCEIYIELLLVLIINLPKLNHFVLVYAAQILLCFVMIPAEVLRFFFIFIKCIGDG